MAIEMFETCKLVFPGWQIIACSRAIRNMTVIKIGILIINYLYSILPLRYKDAEHVTVRKKCSKIKSNMKSWLVLLLADILVEIFHCWLSTKYRNGSGYPLTRRITLNSSVFSPSYNYFVDCLIITICI
jgi:hypothetical protein